MKLDIKPALIIIGTLIIGVVLGALTLSVVMRHRMEKLHGMRSRGGMPQHLIESIGPLQDAQRRALTVEFDRSAARIDSTIQSGRRYIDAMLDSMATRVDSLLTPEQRERLHKELGRRFHGGPGGPGGPPPHMPPFGGPPPMESPDEPPPPR